MRGDLFPANLTLKGDLFNMRKDSYSTAATPDHLGFKQAASPFWMMS
jgi:hypothetical protein